MAKERQRDFFVRNPEKLGELIRLRSDPFRWSSNRLGRYFSVDHTTILYNLKRFAPELIGVKAFATMRMVRPKHPRHYQSIFISICVPLLPAPKPKPKVIPLGEKYRHLYDEPINPGKSYREYFTPYKSAIKEGQRARMSEAKARLDKLYSEGDLKRPKRKRKRSWRVESDI